MLITRPILTARAVIFNDHGQILLAKRSGQTFLSGLWELPGGKLDEGETSAEAMAREIQEETGLDVLARTILLACQDSHKGGRLHTDIWLASLAGSAGPIVLRPREHQDAGWFGLSELPSGLTSTALAAMELLTMQDMAA